MFTNTNISALKKFLSEVSTPEGIAKTDSFSNIRAVQAKIKELKVLLNALGDIGKPVLLEMDQDTNLLRDDSRRVLLEGVSSYCQMALNLIESGIHSTVSIEPLPSIDKLTASTPALGGCIQRRWVEAQKNQQNGCYTSSIIMMGSILEALLLCRAHLSIETANRSTKAPKQKDGKSIAIQDWSLSALIEVSTDVGWLKVDRGKFSHALRESRNIVHPWAEVLIKTNFDEDTCKTSWLVLKASIKDLNNSLN